MKAAALPRWRDLLSYTTSAAQGAEQWLAAQAAEQCHPAAYLQEHLVADPSCRTMGPRRALVIAVATQRRRHVVIARALGARLQSGEGISKAVECKTSISSTSMRM